MQVLPRSRRVHALESKPTNAERDSGSVEITDAQTVVGEQLTHPRPGDKALATAGVLAADPEKAADDLVHLAKDVLVCSSKEMPCSF